MGLPPSALPFTLDDSSALFEIAAYIAHFLTCPHREVATAKRMNSKGIPRSDYLRDVPAGPVREIKRGSHRHYISSDAWKKRRRKLIRQKGKKCAACGRKGWHVHHTTYERLFKEAKDDLVLLCGRCHKLFHDTYGVSKDMRAQTSEFIAEMTKHRASLKEAARLDDEFTNFTFS